MFIRRIARETPSGREPKHLIRNVKKPQPMAKITSPFGVVGVVTQSVAMKKAPSIRPPEKRGRRISPEKRPFPPLTPPKTQLRRA